MERSVSLSPSRWSVSPAGSGLPCSTHEYRFVGVHAAASGGSNDHRVSFHVDAHARVSSGFGCFIGLNRIFGSPSLGMSVLRLRLGVSVVVGALLL